MVKIDAHQHFWQYDAVRHAWIADNMQVIRKDFMPKDLKPLLDANGIDGCIAVQADQSERETEFLLDLAVTYDCVKGVVGWVDILAPNLTERLAQYAQHPFFKGIRHIAQSEADDFLQNPKVIEGIGQLAQFGLTYDILIYGHQLPAAIALVQSLPNQAFVIDHIAKPKISEGLDAAWVANMKTIASFPNVNCKVSGMVTETTNFQWKKADFIPFLDTIVANFGVKRIMYGSDWPVCLLAADYKEQLLIVTDYFATFSETVFSKIMGGNTIKFYNLEKQV